MKKDYLLYLKKLAALGCILTSGLSLTACGNKTEEEVIASESKEEDVDFHEHLMVDIDGTTYIFRECDDEFSKITVITHYGHISYKIYDKNGEKIIDSTSYGDTNFSYVDSVKQEEAVREFEEKAIENGAVLYRGLGN